jgi:DNA-binding transcriptional regulator YbjK
MTESVSESGISFAELDALPTEALRERAFAQARQHRDLAFFWSVLRHLPDADEAATLDGSPHSVGPTVDEAVALWREMTGHGYGEQEPLLRAKFIDYLQHG